MKRIRAVFAALVLIPGAIAGAAVLTAVSVNPEALAPLEHPTPTLNGRHVYSIEVSPKLHGWYCFDVDSSIDGPDCKILEPGSPRILAVSSEIEAINWFAWDQHGGRWTRHDGEITVDRGRRRPFSRGPQP